MKIDKAKLDMMMLDAGIGTQRELARRAGFSMSWTCQVMRKATNNEEVMAKTIQALAIALRCRPTDIIVHLPHGAFK